jgi:hypothetical protein
MTPEANLYLREERGLHRLAKFIAHTAGTNPSPCPLPQGEGVRFTYPLPLRKGAGGGVASGTSRAFRRLVLFGPTPA